MVGPVVREGEPEWVETGLDCSGLRAGRCVSRHRKAPIRLTSDPPRLGIEAKLGYAGKRRELAKAGAKLCDADHLVHTSDLLVFCHTEPFEGSSKSFELNTLLGRLRCVCHRGVPQY